VYLFERHASRYVEVRVVVHNVDSGAWVTKVLEYPVIWNALIAYGKLRTVGKKSEVWVVLAVDNVAVEWPEMELNVVCCRVKGFETIDLSAVVSYLAAVGEAAIIAVAVEALEEVVVTLAKPHGDLD